MGELPVRHVIDIINSLKETMPSKLRASPADADKILKIEELLDTLSYGLDEIAGIVPYPDSSIDGWDLPIEDFLGFEFRSLVLDKLILDDNYTVDSALDWCNKLIAILKEKGYGLDHASLLDRLLDEDNQDPISLFDENGKETKFEQVAIIPYNEKLYCILKPIDGIDGVEDNEALVFYVQMENEMDATLVIETDESVANAVFNEYYKLLEESDSE